MNGQLLRPRFDRKIAGVCAAFARAYGWDVTVVRIVTLVLGCCIGGGFLAYLICWVVIPEDPVGMAPYAGYPMTGEPGGYPPPPPASYPGSYPPQDPPTVPPTA